MVLKFGSRASQVKFGTQQGTRCVVSGIVLVKMFYNTWRVLRIAGEVIEIDGDSIIMPVGLCFISAENSAEVSPLVLASS